MRTAIVADDEPITRLDLVEILTELDFHVAAQAADGFDAVEACRIHHPDLVLMDIKMPVFDGLGAAKTVIQENLAGCVILLTAFDDQEFLERAKDSGVAGYLIKPVEERTLRPAVALALAQMERYHRAVSKTRELEAQILESKLVERAKAILARQEEIAEQDAYQRMRKMSMDRQCRIFEIAKMIVAADPERELVERAKEFLMKRDKVNESTAFRKIKGLSVQNQCSLAAAARMVLKK